jgi:NADH:ubiquinone oxidoreductase subunit
VDNATVDQSPALAYMSRMHLGTWIATLFKGNLVGTDAAGNHYYQERAIRPNGRSRRWIVYNGPVEASAVPPEWHSWLHYTTDKPIQASAHRSWGRVHVANATGTPDSYRPPGHDYEGGRRDRATGDYEAWTPGSE